MSMSIKLKGHRLYDIDAVVKRGGKQFRRRDFDFEGSESQANRRYTELYNLATADADEHFTPKTTPQTLADIIAAKLAAAPPPASYATYYNRVLADCGGYPLTELQTRIHGGIIAGLPVQGYIQLLDSLPPRAGAGNRPGTQNKPGKLSPGAKNKIVMCLKQICQFGHAQGMLDADPMRSLYRKTLWRTTPRNRTLRESDNEFLRILNTITADFPHYAPLFLHSCRNPGRIEDLRKLTVENLYLFEKRIRFVSGKKQVPCTHVIYPELMEYFTDRPAGCPWLFYRHVKETDIYLPIGDIKRAWATIKRTAGVTNLRWHDLRHQAATWLANQPGIKTHHIMVIGGWKTRQMLEVYHNLEHEATASEALDLLTASPAQVSPLVSPNHAKSC
jgi:hypothetical protein